MSDDDGNEPDNEDTTVLDRRQFARHADESTVVQPAVNFEKPLPGPGATAVQPARSAAPTPLQPAPAAVAAPAASMPPPAAVRQQAEPDGGPYRTGRAGEAPRRRAVVGDDLVRVPTRRPWTSVTAAILALIFAADAVYELVHNWSSDHGVPAGRYATAEYLVEHSGSSTTSTLAELILGSHYKPGVHFDTRIALGSYAILWLIVGLLLLVARGSGIVLGLAWSGAVGLATAGRGRSAIDAYGVHHLPGIASVGAAFAPLLLVVLICGLGGSRRARLYSGRPSDPEFVDVNDPGDVWRAS